MDYSISSLNTRVIFYELKTYKQVLIEQSSNLVTDLCATHG